MSKKKVLFVNHEETYTGAPLILFRIAEYFLTMPDRYEILVVSRREGSAHELFSSRLPVVYPEKIYPHLPMYDRASHIIEEWAPDLVYANCTETYEYCVAAKGLGISCIYHVHELDNGFDSLIKSHNFEHGEERQLKFCADLFLCPCEETEDLLMNRCGVDPFKIRVVNEFIDPEEVRRQAEMFLPEGLSGPYVAGCGTAVARKGIDRFFDIARQMPETQFVWIGRMLRPIEDVPPNVLMIGEVTNPFPYLKTAAAFVLTSREDPFPLVVLEAMALGKPVVTSRYGGGSHAAVGNTGIVLNGTETERWVEALRSILADPAAAQKMGEAARRRVDARFTSRQQLQRIHRWVDSLI